MRIKTSICLFSLSLGLLTARMFAGNEFASSSSNGSTASNGDDPLSYEFDAEETYVGGGDVERGFRHIDDVNENNALVRFVFTPRIRIGILRLGAGFERYDFDVPRAAEIPDSLQSATLIVGLDTQFSDSILVRFEAQPGFYGTDFDDFGSGDFNVPFILGGTYIWSSSVQIVLGVGVDLEGKYPVLPGGGVRWKFAPQWTLNAVLPKPRLEFEVNKDLTLYAGAEVKSSNYRVDDHFGDDRGIPRLNHAVIAYSEVRTGAGLDWKLSSMAKLSVEAGYLPYRVFDYHRTDVRYHSDSGAPYGMVALHMAF
jgi:hypothetical protein